MICRGREEKTPRAKEKKTKKKNLSLFLQKNQGELDWKVLCLDASSNDAAAPPASANGGAEAEAAPLRIASLADLERLRPGEVERVVQWFSTYKKLEGSEAGAIGLRGKVLGPRRAAAVVAEGERAYGRLRLEEKQKQQKRELEVEVDAAASVKK